MKGWFSIVNKILALALLAVTSYARTSHVVKPGETIDGISKTHGVSVAAIVSANAIENPALIKPGQELIIPDASAPPPPRTYEVKNGDTLGSIAVAFGTTVKELSELNGITDPKTLRAGRVLNIPAAATGGGTATAAKPATESRHPLPANIKSQLDATPVKAGRWKHIVIHHSGTARGSIQGMDMYHRKHRKMENGLAYHFVIGNGRDMGDGEIAIGNRWKRQIKGGHVTSDAQNQVALGICLVGNFEVAPPTAAQMRSLYGLTAYLMRRCGIPKKEVKTHRQINIKPTACPGKLFPTQRFIENL
jgi:LysM repeat protein